MLWLYILEKYKSTLIIFRTYGFKLKLSFFEEALRHYFGLLIGDLNPDSYCLSRNPVNDFHKIMRQFPIICPLIFMH